MISKNMQNKNQKQQIDATTGDIISIQCHTDWLSERKIAIIDLWRPPLNIQHKHIHSIYIYIFLLADSDCD